MVIRVHGGLDAHNGIHLEQRDRRRRALEVDLFDVSVQSCSSPKVSKRKIFWPSATRPDEAATSDVIFPFSHPTSATPTVSATRAIETVTILGDLKVRTIVCFILAIMSVSLLLRRPLTHSADAGCHYDVSLSQKLWSWAVQLDTRLVFCEPGLRARATKSATILYLNGSSRLVLGIVLGDLDRETP